MKLFSNRLYEESKEYAFRPEENCVNLHKHVYIGLLYFCASCLIV